MARELEVASDALMSAPSDDDTVLLTDLELGLPVPRRGGSRLSAFESASRNASRAIDALILEKKLCEALEVSGCSCVHGLFFKLHAFDLPLVHAQRNAERIMHIYSMVGSV